MKQLIPSLIAGVFIVIGGAGGYFVKNMGSAEASTASAGHGEASGHGEKESSGHDKPKADKGGGHDKEESGASGDIAYYKFTREFVVPLIRNERVESLVIINLNLEVDSSESQKLFSMEPKLRDNIMTTLIKLSNDGDTLHTLTDVDHYETIRSMVLANLQGAISESIQNVLILDMAKQDL